MMNEPIPDGEALCPTCGTKHSYYPCDKKVQETQITLPLNKMKHILNMLSEGLENTRILVEETPLDNKRNIHMFKVFEAEAKEMEELHEWLNKQLYNL